MTAGNLQLICQTEQSLPASESDPVRSNYPAGQWGIQNIALNVAKTSQKVDPLVPVASQDTEPLMTTFARRWS